MPPFATLKVRAEFLAVRGGARASVPCCLIETRPRRVSQLKADSAPEVARFGFTITKKLGNAVIRNRIRRRLKAAIAEIAPGLARAGNDYVVVARAAALERPFADIKSDLTRAFEILARGGHKPSHREKNPRRKGSP